MNSLSKPVTKLFKKLALLMLIMTLAACGQSQDNTNTIKVGVISGPDTEVMDVAREVAQQKYDINLVVVPFSSYTMPNAALNDGSIDANIFQHVPYLQAAIKAKHYQIVPIGKTFIYPMGIFSKSVKNVQSIPNKSSIAIPNDPTNEARALLLLQKAGLITLKPGVTTTATVMDIAKNPKHLKIVPLGAAQLPRVLNDVAAAVINTNFAIPAGLSPKHDEIYQEGVDSLYANVIVVRTKDKDNPLLLKLIPIMHSQAVVKKAQSLYHDQAIPAWKGPSETTDS